MTTFNNNAMALGTMGVSVFVSSGDDGVANYECTEASECGYVGEGIGCTTPSTHTHAAATDRAGVPSVTLAARRAPLNPTRTP